MLGARPHRQRAGLAAGGIVLLKGAGWYDYEAKYAEGGMELQVPARISDAARERVREIAVRAFRISGCSGLAYPDLLERLVEIGIERAQREGAHDF